MTNDDQNSDEVNEAILQEIVNGALEIDGLAPRSARAV
jgi:hypothetical protein